MALKTQSDEFWSEMNSFCECNCFSHYIWDEFPISVNWNMLNLSVIG